MTTHTAAAPEKRARRIWMPNDLRYRVDLDERYSAPGRPAEIRQWCRTNLQGGWSLVHAQNPFGYAMGFSRRAEAALFMLTWC